jgi:glutaredoxin
MKVTIIVVTTIVVILGLVILGSRAKNSNDFNTSDSAISVDPIEQSSETVNRESNDIIFYYGITCPHCKDVEEYITNENVLDKLPIVSKEVYQNRVNSLELSKVAEACGLDTRSIGVPFLFSKGECYVGSPDVIAEIERQMSLTVKESTQ